MDTTHIRYRNRAAAIIKQILEYKEDLKELKMEMKHAGVDEIQIVAIERAAKRMFWDDKRRQREEVIGQLVLELQAVGELENAD